MNFKRFSLEVSACAAPLPSIFDFVKVWRLNTVGNGIWFNLLIFWACLLLIPTLFIWTLCALFQWVWATQAEIDDRVQCYFGEPSEKHNQPEA